MTGELAVGATVMFSSGSYSDYQVHVIGRVVKPINEAVWERMKASCTHGSKYDPDGKSFHQGEAIPWFIANGYVEEVEYTELYLGDYGDAPKWGQV